MKKILILTLGIILICMPAFAKRQVNAITLRMATDNTAISNYDNMHSGDHYTQPVSISQSTNSGALITRAENTGMYNLGFSYELSDDGIHFYEPMDLSDSGAQPFSVATVLSCVTANGYYTFDNQPGNYIRFKITSKQTSLATVIYIYQTAD